jgi:hypothetical protein
LLGASKGTPPWQQVGVLVGLGAPTPELLLDSICIRESSFSNLLAAFSVWSVSSMHSFCYSVLSSWPCCCSGSSRRLVARADRAAFFEKFLGNPSMKRGQSMASGVAVLLANGLHVQEIEEIPFKQHSTYCHQKKVHQNTTRATTADVPCLDFLFFKSVANLSDVNSNLSHDSHFSEYFFFAFFNAASGPACAHRSS